MNKKSLVVGPPGSGKTFISEELSRNNIPAYDADKLEGLSCWIDSRGKKVSFPDHATSEWLSENKFVWDKVFLEDFLSSRDELILFGISSNVWEFVDLFDTILYLDLDEGVLLDRLGDESRSNPMGKSKAQRGKIISGMQTTREKAIKYGAKLADAEMSPLEFYEEYFSK